MAARSSSYHPYAMADHSALYHHPSFASASPYRSVLVVFEPVQKFQ